MRTSRNRWLVLGIWALFALPAVAADWKPATGPLKTKWAADVTPTKVHPEYPRPQMVRGEWKNLNGLWDVAVTPRNAKAPAQLLSTQQILVPFPIESALSGVMKRVTENDRIWYRTEFHVPSMWRGKRVLLNFGAVDFEAVTFVNGQEVGRHRGGYSPFSCDITDALNKVGPHELVVAVWDPTDAGTQPRGKQIRNPHGIWYTPTSGIWQTVWIEPVTAAHITSLEITPKLDEQAVTVTPATTAPLGRHTVEVQVRDAKGKLVTEAKLAPGGSLTLPVKNPKLWSPEDPYLYDLIVTLKLGSRTLDRVESYFGMRKISLGKDSKGFTRILLNNKPYFQFGPLDQGFWPDGLYTAPTDEALRFDIEMTRKLGFNMARKHVKVEPARWYYWADRLGLLVWQDMPSGEKYIGARDPDITRSPESGAQFEKELTEMIQSLRNHPSIVMWVPYNEGWGQWDTARIAEMVKKLDPTRLVNSASGWTDRGVGDVHDMHNYPGPGSPDPEKNRAAVLGEFGGLGYPVRGHTWQSERNWGYRNYTNAATLTLAYENLISRLFPLIRSHGLSAAVYTQTTDVEGEVNGLLTYDRAILKISAEKLKDMNEGKVPPPPEVSAVVLPTSQKDARQWRYVTEKPADGWFKPRFDDASWKIGQGGFGSPGTPGAEVGTEWKTGDIWLRQEFECQVPSGGELQLMVHHDEDAEVFINGVLAATLKGHLTEYPVSAYEPLRRHRPEIRQEYDSGALS